MQGIVKKFMAECFQNIEVAVPVPIFKTFIYKVNLSVFVNVCPGQRVLVPFGRRKLTGYILTTNYKSIFDPCKIKQIYDVIDKTPIFPASMIKFYHWIAKYYFYPIGEVIKSALPAGINFYDTFMVVSTSSGHNALLNNSLSDIEKKILTSIADSSLSLKSVTKKAGVSFSMALIRSMEKKGLLLLKRELKTVKIRPRKIKYIHFLSDASEGGKAGKSKELLSMVKSAGSLSLKELRSHFPSASKLIKPMEKKGLIQICEKEFSQNPLGEAIIPDTPPKLTDEQTSVVNTIYNSFKNGYAAYLLCGVTGSGKTEVYMDLAAKTADRGQCSLILVPEIALLSQIISRFRSRFGDMVAVIHSNLTHAQKYDQWLKIIKKRVCVVIGARSVIFAPVDNLGLVIVDEEHDTSYKQNSSLLYNAKDMAVVRAKQSDCTVVLGSATPSIHSFYNCSINKFTPLYLKKRINNRSLSEVCIVDLKTNKGVSKKADFITRPLYEAMKKALSRGEQILLFLNRRGFANYLLCGNCGEVQKCKRCDISMTFHKMDKTFKCHYCDYWLSADSICTKCGSSNIKILGSGTQKLEQAILELFPNAKTARLDRDSTRKKGALVSILKKIQNREIDIIIGTQIIAKGHDFPNITLVGIICADLSLNFPDFRAGERTFQLLAQVAGRAGRGEQKGMVILQTYNHDHFCIQAAEKQDFVKFYETEIQFRKALDYPPFSKMVQIKISGKNLKQTENHVKQTSKICRKLISGNSAFKKNIEVLGPVKSPVFKIADNYRWQILLKAKNIGALYKFLHEFLFIEYPLIKTPKVKSVLDVDPFFMM